MNNLYLFCASQLLIACLGLVIPFMTFFFDTMYQKIMYTLMMLMYLPMNNLVQSTLVNDYIVDTKAINTKYINKLPIIYYIGMPLLNIINGTRFLSMINDNFYVVYVSCALIYIIKLNIDLEKIVLLCDTEYVTQYRYIQTVKKRTNEIAYNILFITSITDAFLLLLGYIGVYATFFRIIFKLIVFCIHYTNYLFLANAKQKRIL